MTVLVPIDPDCTIVELISIMEYLHGNPMVSHLVVTHKGLVSHYDDASIEQYLDDLHCLRIDIIRADQMDICFHDETGAVIFKLMFP